MAEQWRITEGISGDTIWDGDRPIGTVNKDVVHRMAAAQEMLAALEKIVLEFEGYGSDGLDLAIAAIAKAKGK